MSAAIDRIVRMPGARLLPAAGSLPSYAAHVRRLGPLPYPARPRRGGCALADDVEAAGLVGRGGAGFPTARKLRTAVASGGRGYVVVNAAESEPASGKDGALLSRAPHLVLDGAQVAAVGTGARGVSVWAKAGAGRDAVLAALAERDDAVPTTVQEAPDSYLAGESSAAVDGGGGGRGLPRFRDRPAAVRGIRNRPTVLVNVETAADLGLLPRLGPAGFRAVGCPDEPGTLLLTLRGDEVVVAEAPTGTVLRDAWAAAGLHAPDDDAPVVLGGWFGSWHRWAEVRDVELTRQSLRAVGGELGAGVVAPLPLDTCAIGEAARVTRWLAGEGAQQCGACRFGLPAVAGELERLAAGHADGDPVALLNRWAGMLAGRGACAHPDGVAGFVTSAVRALAAEAEQHRSGHCGRAVLGVLPVGRAPA
jgi:NADH:ubiquinone oxidoreductase subunit F (NADH-binding)